MVPNTAPEPLPPLQLVQTPLPLTSEQLQLSTDANPAPYVSETRIRRGDTVASVMQRLGLDDPKLLTFLTQDASARSFYKLYPGRPVQAATDGHGKLAWMRYVHTLSAQNEEDEQATTRMLVIRPNQKDGYIAEEREEDTSVETNVASGVIRSSLFAATDAAGIPDAITQQIADILGSKIDFLHGLREGDQFRVVYETRSHEGRYAGAGRVLAVEFTNNGKTFDAAWFSPDEGAGAYYDFDGRNLHGAFLSTALKFSRISSTFGMRTHPLHQTWTSHKGVDYSAPTGTPIHTTADGVVEFAGWQNGYGNVVIIKHFGQYSTLYAHQSRIAPGIHQGVSVSQGQVIGYVGMTGWATGPHLHYEFRVDNQPVNPLSVDLPMARALDPGERKAFAEALEPYRDEIELMTQLQQPDRPASDGHIASR